MAILAPLLRELDEVAYLRYASVYRNFSSPEDFEGEIALLRCAFVARSTSSMPSRVATLSRNTLQDTAAHLVPPARHAAFISASK
jgi:hypothetical protein